MEEPHAPPHRPHDSGARESPPPSPPDQGSHAALRWGVLWLDTARASHATDAMIHDRAAVSIALLTSTPPPASQPLAVESIPTFGAMETAHGTIASIRTGLREGDPNHVLFVSTLQVREFWPARLAL